MPLFFCNPIFAQQGSLKLIAEVPIQFGVGYEGKINNRFSAAVSGGILTPPNSTLITYGLQQLGVDTQVVSIIKNSFSFGVVGKAGVNYNFRRNYAGVFFEVLGLHTGQVSAQQIEDRYNTSMTSYPLLKGRSSSSDNSLNLTSTLYQAGILYGRRFPLGNKRFEIDAEFGLSANVGSVSRLTSKDRTISSLSSEVNAELSYYYSHYAFVPSLMIAGVWKIRRQ